MKRYLLAICALLFWAGSALAEELVVFAAASLTETLTEIKGVYEASHPDVTITYSFDSSGTLKRQIEEGAPCDLFISAGQKQMDGLEPDFVDASARVDLLENRVALVVSSGAERPVESFDDLARRLASRDIFMAIGNSDVPVGQYTQKIFAFFGLDEASLAEAGCLSFGTNVKEVVTQVAEGSVMCGIVYATDAASAGLAAVDFATSEMCGRAIYPAAPIKGAKAPDAARDFLGYLMSDGMRIFERAGFSPVR